MGTSKTSRGFTIVELLIVIVVIAILAAITIVAFNGVQNRARIASLQSDVSQAAKQLENTKTASGVSTYPTTLPTTIGASSGNTLNYYYRTGEDTWCITASKDSLKYSISNQSLTPKEGSCSYQGLVGWWPLNGNANDQSGNGNNGTIVGATLASGQNGQPNQAYAFNGTSGRINLGNSTTLNAKSVTYSAWVNRSVAGTQTVMAKQNQYKCGYDEVVDEDPYFTLRYNSRATGAYLQAGFFNGVPVATGQWTHVACVFSNTSTSTGGNVTLQVYANGVDLGGVNFTYPPVTIGYNTNPLMIGSATAAGSELFSGSIDDVRVYSRVLTAAEVLTLYNEGAQ